MPKYLMFKVLKEDSLEDAMEQACNEMDWGGCPTVKNMTDAKWNIAVIEDEDEALE